VPDNVIPTLKAALDKASTRHELEILKRTTHGYCFPERKDYNAEAAEHTWEKLFQLWGRNLG